MHKKMIAQKKRIASLAVLALITLCIFIPTGYSSEPKGFTDTYTETGGKGALIDEITRAIFIYPYTGGWLLTYGNSFSNNFRIMILANPSITDASSPSHNIQLQNTIYYIISLVVPLYVLAIAITGFYMLFYSGSPEGRTKKKELLKRLILSLIVFYLSPYILQLMMLISYNLSDALMDSVDLNNAREVLQGGLWGGYWIFASIGMTSLELSGAFWASLLAMSWLPYLLLGLRYILVVFFCLAFPIGIILYSFNFMRDLGRQILEQTILWIFLQVFLSAAVVAIALSIEFYYIVPQSEDIKLSGINFMIPPMGGAIGMVVSAGVTLIMPYLTSFIMSATNSTFMATSILRFTLGSASYALFIAVPFLMMRILHKFLP